MKIKNKVPPYECVPWFEENFKVGDKIALIYNGGLGGWWETEGVISKFDTPDIYLEGHSYSYTMRYIEIVSKL